MEGHEVQGRRQHGQLDRNEFIESFAKWFESWNTDRSGTLTDQQLRAGIDKALMPPMPGIAPARTSRASAAAPAGQPVERTDGNSRIAHQQLLEKASDGRIDIYCIGDFITRRWGGTDYRDAENQWKYCANRPGS